MVQLNERLRPYERRAGHESRSRWAPCHRALMRPRRRAARETYFGPEDLVGCAKEDFGAGPFARELEPSYGLARIMPRLRAQVNTTMNLFFVWRDRAKPDDGAVKRTSGSKNTASVGCQLTIAVRLRKFDCAAGRSSNGRTPDSGSGYLGSSPCLPAINK